MTLSLIIPVLASIEGEDGIGFPSAWVRCQFVGASLLKRSIETTRSVFEVSQITVLSDLPDVKAAAKRLGVAFRAVPSDFPAHSANILTGADIGASGPAIILSPRLPLVSAAHLEQLADQLHSCSAAEVIVPARHHPATAFRASKDSKMDFSLTMDSDNWQSLDAAGAWQWNRLIRGIGIDPSLPKTWLVGDPASCMVIRSQASAQLAIAAESRIASQPWRVLRSDGRPA